MAKMTKVTGGGDSHAVAVTVRLDRAFAARLADVVSGLKRAGLSDVEAHERLMMVNGTIDNDRVEALKRIDGVVSVREDAVYRAS